MLTPLDFILCIVGWLIYTLFILRKDKGIIDEQPRKKFHIAKYAEDMWDDWLFTLASSTGLLLIAPEVFLVLSAKWSWMEGIYWSSKIPFFLGAFGGVIFQGLYDVVKAFMNKLKKKVE